MRAQPYVRFGDEALPAALLRELIRAGVRYTVDGSEAVLFSKAAPDAVVSAAHRVRDAQFPWYFLKWKTESESARCRAALSQAGLPVFVERHETGIWFLVRRSDKPHHERLSYELMPSNSPLQRPDASMAPISARR